MNSRRCLQIAAAAGFLAVAFGSFGAHGLKERISEASLTTFETGVRYQMYHALALFGVGLLMRGRTEIPRGYRVAAGGFIAGMILFSGSLYVLAITGIKIMGMVAPFGGVAMMVGWFALVPTVGKDASA